MITRMWEARIDPDHADRVAAALAGQSGPWAAREVYRSHDGADRLVVISHWPDEAALAAYAGADWLTDPSVELAGAVSGDVARHLIRPAYVWHFLPVTAPRDR